MYSLVNNIMNLLIALSTLYISLQLFVTQDTGLNNQISILGTLTNYSQNKNIIHLYNTYDSYK